MAGPSGSIAVSAGRTVARGAEGGGRQYMAPRLPPENPCLQSTISDKECPMPGRVYTGQRNYLIVNDKSSPATVGNKGS